jgi:hypothetical protein
MHKIFLLENVKGKHHLEDLGVDDVDCMYLAQDRDL